MQEVQRKNYQNDAVSFPPSGQVGAVEAVPVTCFVLLLTDQVFMLIFALIPESCLGFTL